MNGMMAYLLPFSACSNAGSVDWLTEEEGFWKTKKIEAKKGKGVKNKK